MARWLRVLSPTVPDPAGPSGGGWRRREGSELPGWEQLEQEAHPCHRAEARHTQSHGGKAPNHRVEMKGGKERPVRGERSEKVSLSPPSPWKSSAWGESWGRLAPRTDIPESSQPVQRETSLQLKQASLPDQLVGHLISMALVNVQAGGGHSSNWGKKGSNKGAWRSKEFLSPTTGQRWMCLRAAVSVTSPGHALGQHL